MSTFLHSDFLLPESSFITGMGSCLSIAGNYYEYNVSPSAWIADRNAIYMDWKMIGNDFRECIRNNPYKSLKLHNQSLFSANPKEFIK